MSVQISNMPHADFLMGSMRSLGYTFESAIADIIDNGISAYAEHIQLRFPMDSSADCYVSILDNGIGLNKKSLLEAMRYGSYSCEATRDKYDLGRFGLGLKAASLSQCKILTVVSKENSTISAYQWNYDFVLSKKEWLVLELTDEEIQLLPEISELKELKSGTLVIWSEFDVLQKSHGNVFSTLKNYKEKLVDYLSLIYHRFLNGDAHVKIDIAINNHHLKGSDPFLEKHKKTNQRQEFNLAIKDSANNEKFIHVTPFILPFQKDLSRDDIQLIGGVENLVTKQGFYIYRNYRLIIWGTWFGLKRHELTKNARIRVDIPNCLDDIWNIDIKKQNATIPKQIRNQLERSVKEVLELATNQQTYRGRINRANNEIDYVWNRIQGRDNTFHYTINRESRIFSLLKQNIPDDIMARFDIVLEEIENNIPYQQIYIDISKETIGSTEDMERLKDIENKGILCVNNILQLNESLSVNKVIDDLFYSEPFCNHEYIKHKLYNYFKV